MRRFERLVSGIYAYSTNTLELVSETQTGVVINRSRDAFGRESGIALEESDYNVSYGYDAYGRFGAVTSDSLLVTNNFTYSYLPGSSLVSGMAASSGHAWTRSYEPNRNLITAVTNLFNGNLISAFDYINDEIGRRTARLDALPGAVATTNVFGYNTRSEVTSANMGTNTYGYVFDPIGNRITATNNAGGTSYAANEINQYIAISNAVTVLPSYDEDGNMLTNGVLNYTWDGENRLNTVSSNGVLLVTYAYDCRSRRIGKEVLHLENNIWVVAESRAFLYDGWNLIRETTENDLSYYIWGEDFSGTLQGAGGIGGLMAIVRGGNTYTPAFDANGNITEYTDSNGIIVAHYEYSPFGEAINEVSSFADSFDLRFSSKYWEKEGTLYYFGYRFYQPVLGRWQSRDPIGESGGVAVYQFLFNSSLVSADYLGMMMVIPPGSSLRKLPCCGSTPFDPEKQCCCPKTIIEIPLDDGPMVTKEELVVVEKTQITSGVVTYIWRGPNAKWHHWMTWPGGSADSNSSFLLTPPGDQIVHSPAMGMSSDGTPTEVMLSPCSYDFTKLHSCLSRVANDLAGKSGGLCDAFVKSILQTCLSESKGCTAP